MGCSHMESYESNVLWKHLVMGGWWNAVRMLYVAWHDGIVMAL